MEIMLAMNDYFYQGSIAFLIIIKCSEEADVVLLVGARLNWMLHFGTPPRWSSTVKVIQVDKQFSSLLSGWLAPSRIFKISLFNAVY